MNTTNMQKINNWLKTLLIVALIIVPVKNNFAGNEQRAGQAELQLEGFLANYLFFAY